MARVIEKVAVDVPVDTEDLDIKAKAAIEDINALQEFHITDQETAQFAAEYLSETLRDIDEAEAEEGRALEHVKAITKIIRGWWKPYKHAKIAVRDLLKSRIGAYQLRRDKEEREARELAAKAASKGDYKTMTGALARAADAAPQKIAGASVTAFWEAEVINPGLVPYEYLSPDLAKIGALAKSTPTEGPPPVCPGVRFTLQSRVRASHAPNRP